MFCNPAPSTVRSGMTYHTIQMCDKCKQIVEDCRYDKAKREVSFSDIDPSLSSILNRPGIWTIKLKPITVINTGG